MCMQRMNDSECAVLSPCFFFLALQVSQQKSIKLSHDLHSVSLDALTLDYPVSNLGSVGDHQRSLDLTAGTTLAPFLNWRSRFHDHQVFSQSKKTDVGQISCVCCSTVW